MTANAASRLIRYYVDNFRRLPWRSPPGKSRPGAYRVWLSEVMLQQTSVAAVTPRFERFLKRWPNIESLAAAPDEDVLKEWAGLGYYARARNLIVCAREVAAAGGFPSSAQDLRRLPGLGDYTAAAIAAIAFGEDSAPIDTNVRRVIARLFGLAGPNRKEIERRFLELVPSGQAGDFAQAMMDLGATICRPRDPRCTACPVAMDCVALASGNPELFPARKQREPRPLRFGTAWWIERDGKLWLVRRPKNGMLGGMAALPGTDWGELVKGRDRAIGTIRHVFTHFALDLAIVHRDEPFGEGWWHDIERLDEAGLPTLYRRAAELVAGAAERAPSPLRARLEVNETHP